MNLEQHSVDFLQWHMSRKGFRELIEELLVTGFEWMEETFEKEPSVRAVARMEDHEGKDSNLILLFPPFYTTKPDKYYKDKEWTTYWK